MSSSGGEGWSGFVKAATDSSGTIEIGVSESILADTPLCSISTPTRPASIPWGFVLKRGEETLLTMTEAGETQLLSLPDESLTVEFSNEYYGESESFDGKLAINMWVVVPEPATLSLLTMAGLCGIAYAWRRTRASGRGCHRPA